MVKFLLKKSCSVGVLLSCSLLLCCAHACNHTDDRVSYIDDIQTCNGSDVVISFNFSGVAEYHIAHEKLPDPIFHNETGLCQVFLTLHNVIYEDFVNATLQVQIQTPPLHAPYFNCSNNFSLIFDTDPPSPVSTLDSHINCSGVFLSWLEPYSSLSCPILHYLIILNNNNHTDVITPQSFFKYSWSELSHDTLYTVSIVAVSGAGSSIESNSTEFTTALAPKVIMIDYDVPLLVEDAVVLVKAKVANTDCPFSYPSHVQYSIQCNDGYVKNHTFNVTVNATDGSIIQHGKPLPLGLCNCRALITWYNRNNSTQGYINFNTSSPISINVNHSTCEMFLIHCSYSLSLSNSTWLGCAVDIFNSTSRVAGKFIPFLNSWNTSLHPGDYNISVVGCYDNDCVRNVSVCQDAKRFINIKKCHISSTTITSTPAVIPTSSSSSTPSSDDGSDNTTLTIVLPVVFGLFIIIIIIVIVVALLLYFSRKKKKGSFILTVPEESTVPSQIGKPVIAPFRPSTKTHDSAMALQSMRKGPNIDNENADSTACRSFSETESTVLKSEANEGQGNDDVPMSYDTAPAEASAATPGGSEVITKQVNKNEKQLEPSTNTEGTTTTGAIGGGATKEPIYSDLDVAPTGTKSLAKTEAPTVQYADIESVRPKVPPVQSYDDVVVSASGTTVIGATGGDTNPPPIPDKKSKGAATTGQETNGGAATTGQETNGGTDAAQDFPHTHDDKTIDETQARTPTDYKMVIGIEDMTTIDEANETNNVNSSPTQTNSDNLKQSQPEESAQSSKIKAPVQPTDDSSSKTYAGLLIPSRSSIPQFSTVASTDFKPPAKNNDDKESKMATLLSTACTEGEEQ